MEFKSVLSTWLIEEFLRTQKPFFDYQYSHFSDIFNEIGFVSISDVQRELRTGEKSKVFVPDKNFVLKPFNKGGIECNLLLIEGFDITKNGFVQRNYLRELFYNLERKCERGEIGMVVNPTKPSLLEDKKSLIDFSNAGFPVLETFYFSDFEDFAEFINSSDETFVVKHRFGSEGRGVYLANQKTYQSLQKIGIEDFVVQKQVDIANEKRFIFFQQELLASRIIHDRTMPWEARGIRRHETFPYNPTEEEIERARKLFDYTQAILGCIDTIQLKTGEDLILEYNGAGTGLGSPDSPYDCNRIVAEKLKNLMNHG